MFINNPLSKLTSSFFTFFLIIVSIQGQEKTDFPEEMIKLLELVNQERKSNGANPLTMDVKLVEAADTHAEDMYDNRFLSHTGSDGSSVGQRVRRKEYQWTRVAENIAQGQRTITEVHNSWMNSSGHRRNILNGNYTQIGLARRGYYWVQVFATPSVLSVPDIEQGKGWSVTIYPNPLQNSSDRLYISSSIPEVSFRIYDINGRQIKQGKLLEDQGEINLSMLAKGQYVIELSTDNRKITKQLNRN